MDSQRERWAIDFKCWAGAGEVRLTLLWVCRRSREGCQGQNCEKILASDISGKSPGNPRGPSLHFFPLVPSREVGIKDFSWLSLFTIRLLHHCWMTFFLIIYFNWRLINLQYCSGIQYCKFCHTSTWISHGCTRVSPPEPPSHLPPYPIPLGHPSAPALSTLSHASNLDRQSASHMIIYTFQRYPLKSSHPHLLPQSPKDCSLHLCLFCCLAYRVIVTIFLNSIYVR